jgi:hypothetical protein
MHPDLILLLFMIILFLTSTGLFIWALTIEECNPVQHITLTKPNLDHLEQLKKLARQKRISPGL